jgi:predicted transcriptional regulator
MSEADVKDLVQLLEKSLMVQLHSLGVTQSDIAKMLNKSKATVNAFLKPLANKGKS